MGVWSAMPGESEGCSAGRMWRHACASLAAPGADAAWQQIVDSSPPDSVWHSLRNCVAYQAGVWHNLLCKGMEDVSQPAAFKLAIVLRHTPSELAARLLAELLSTQPQSAQEEMTSYVLTLLTDDEATRCDGCGRATVSAHGEEEGEEEGEAEGEAEGKAEGDAGGKAKSEGGGGGETKSAEAEGEGEGDGKIASGGVPLRDLRLFGDCELAVLAASREEYDAHAKLVRAEYSKLAQRSYVELRIKVLNQFAQIPKLFHTSEFECLEGAARENVEREICTLQEHLLADRPE